MIDRRAFLGSAGAAAAAALLPAPRRRSNVEVISHQPDLYHGWPTLVRRRNGQLLLAYSGGREAHVCPFGRVELMRSDDEGRTWSWPQVVLDGPIDDRDAGALETARGTLLVTSFTSLAYEKQLERAEQRAAAGERGWPEAKLRRWRAAHRRAGAD